MKKTNRLFVAIAAVVVLALVVVVGYVVITGRQPSASVTPSTSTTPTATIAPIGTIFAAPIESAGDTSVTNLTTVNDLQTEINNTSTAIVIYICGDQVREACNLQDKVIEQLAQQYGGTVKFFKVDVTNAPELAQAFSITSFFDMPLIFVAKDKDSRPTPFTGYLSAEELTVMIDAVLAAPTATATPTPVPTQPAVEATEEPFVEHTPGTVITLTTANIQQEMSHANGDVVIYVCGDNINPACADQDAVIEALAEEYRGRVTFYKVDADVSADLAQGMGIQSPAALPVYFIGDGSNSFNISGSLSAEQLSAVLDALHGLHVAAALPTLAIPDVVATTEATSAATAEATSELSSEATSEPNS